MELSNALLIYFIIFIIIFLISHYYSITPISSFIFALFVSIIILSVIYPVSLTSKTINNSILMFIYYIIYILSTFFIMLYLIYKILSDRSHYYPIN